MLPAAQPASSHRAKAQTVRSSLLSLSVSGTGVPRVGALLRPPRVDIKPDTVEGKNAHPDFRDFFHPSVNRVLLSPVLTSQISPNSKIEPPPRTPSPLSLGPNQAHKRDRGELLLRLVLSLCPLALGVARSANSGELRGGIHGVRRGARRRPAASSPERVSAVDREIKRLD